MRRLLGERDDARLGNAVGGALGAGAHTGDRGDIDNAPVAGIGHGPGRFLGAVEAAMEVDPEDAVEVFRRHVEEGVPEAGAGHIGENVDAAVARNRLGGEPPGVFRVGYIDDEAVRPETVGLEVRRHDLGPFGAEGSDYRPADSPASPRHRRNPPLQPHRSSPRFLESPSHSVARSRAPVQNPLTGLAAFSYKRGVMFDLRGILLLGLTGARRA